MAATVYLIFCDNSLGSTGRNIAIMYTSGTRDGFPLSSTSHYQFFAHPTTLAAVRI